MVPAKQLHMDPLTLVHKTDVSIYPLIKTGHVMQSLHKKTNDSPELH